MERLLCCGNVDCLIELILVLTVNSRRNVTGGIKGGAVALQNEANGHIPLVEIYDGCAVVDLKKSHIAELLYLGRHLIGVEGLTLVGIKFNVKKLVGLLILLKADVNKPTPKGKILCG